MPQLIAWKSIQSSWTSRVSTNTSCYHFGIYSIMKANTLALWLMTQISTVATRRFRHDICLVSLEVLAEGKRYLVMISYILCMDLWMFVRNWLIKGLKSKKSLGTTRMKLYQFFFREWITGLRKSNVPIEWISGSGSLIIGEEHGIHCIPCSS